MFDSNAVKALKQALPAFSLDKPCNTSLLADVFTDYFEHYGFFDTLKDFEGDYYFGCINHSINGVITPVATHFWQPLEPRGTMLVVHGLFDHVGIFQTLIRYLLNQNYAVLALDLPGHGLSGGEPTAVKHFSDYSHVVKATIEHIPAALLVKPIYGLGQSTGAAVLMGLLYHCETKNEPIPFERLVFLGPLIRPRRWRISRVTLKLFGGIIKTITRDMSTPNSHDEEFHNFLKHHDPLQAKRLHVSWVKALDLWITFCASAQSLNTPVLIIQGTGDRVVDWRKNVPQMKALFPCHQVNFIEGAMHHLANESDPWQKAIYAGIGQFLKQRVVCERRAVRRETKAAKRR